MDFSALLVSLVSQHPILATIIMAVGTLRLVLKPVMTCLEQVAAATPTPKDDAVVQEVEASRFYKGAVFVLDYLASIKVLK